MPTYGFILCILATMIIGFVKCVGGCPVSSLPAGIYAEPGLATAVGTVTLFTILKAFSSGATALTGVEAISNGVPAFRRPQSKNASQTLGIMGAIAITMFLGISWLTTHIHGITISPDRSVVAQIGAAIYGEKTFPFYVVQAFTAAILILAANTAYQDFPRLSSILARDRFMPRQFMNRGDRLVFSNGVIGLALGSILVIVAFDANLNKLIQMYVVGVFTSFTLSQTGMVRHWWRERLKGKAGARGWQTSIVINAIGAVTTAIVLCVVTATKFRGGAWLSITVMVLFVPTLRSIHRHYATVGEQLERGLNRAGDAGTNHVVLIVRDLDAATAEALGYLRSFRSSELRAIWPGGDSVPPEVQERWRELSGGAGDLIPIGAGDLLDAVRDYVRGIERSPNDFITVLVPEVVSEGLLAYVLRRRQLVRLKSGLLREPNVVVTDVPVAVEGDAPVGVDGKAWIPERTVTLVFVSGVNDATVRAVNYARSLGGRETRAIYFDLDPDEAHELEEKWFDARMGIPLDIVEAPFRDLTGPMLDEVRRFSVRTDTVVNVVIPEFLVSKRRHLLLHNQNAIFIKRLFLYEPRAVLTAVPFRLEAPAARGPALR